MEAWHHIYSLMKRIWFRVTLANISHMSDEELIELFEKPAYFKLYPAAAIELRNRSRDISFTAPHFAKMSRTRNPAVRQSGRTGLNLLF